jgi:hypothetical protein
MSSASSDPDACHPCFQHCNPYVERGIPSDHLHRNDHATLGWRELDRRRLWFEGIMRYLVVHKNVSFSLPNDLYHFAFRPDTTSRGSGMIVIAGKVVAHRPLAIGAICIAALFP